MVSIYAGILTILFNQISKVLRTVEIDKPFAKENAKRLTIIGAVLVIWSIVYRAAAVFVAWSIIHTFDIPNIQLNYSPDGFMLLSGLMMLILAGVFNYGNYLQQEYDSTI